jgi:hypothetical protein
VPTAPKRERGVEGYEASLMRCLAQRLIPGLAAELKPGARQSARRLCFPLRSSYPVIGSDANCR